MKKDLITEKLEQYDYIDSSYSKLQEYKYQSLIGLFFMRFSYIENEIEQLVSELINDRSHQLWYIMISEYNFRQKIILLEKLVKINMYENNVTLDTKILLRYIREISEFRNKLAHVNWATLKKWGILRYKTFIDNESSWVVFKRLRFILEI